MTVVSTRERRSDFLTVAEVAKELRCSEPTIRRRIRSVDLPAVRLGPGRSAIRVPRVELVAWLQTSRIGCAHRKADPRNAPKDLALDGSCSEPESGSG